MPRPSMRHCALLALGLIAGHSPGALADPAASSTPDAPPVELAPVVVKGARIHLDSLAEQVRKALQTPTTHAPSADLNQASLKMQTMATRLSDPDAYRHSAGDHRFDTLPPPGDETNGCGADLTQGCEQKP